jgi:hypothetical protein
MRFSDGAFTDYAPVHLPAGYAPAVEFDKFFGRASYWLGCKTWHTEGSQVVCDEVVGTRAYRSGLASVYAMRETQMPITSLPDDAGAPQQVPVRGRSGTWVANGLGGRLTWDEEAGLHLVVDMFEGSRDDALEIAAGIEPEPVRSGPGLPLAVQEVAFYEEGFQAPTTAWLAAGVVDGQPCAVVVASLGDCVPIDGASITAQGFRGHIFGWANKQVRGVQIGRQDGTTTSAELTDAVDVGGAQLYIATTPDLFTNPLIDAYALDAGGKRIATAHCDVCAGPQD